jgi:BirA family biotin operon repressor/biotin-[acetyl-CoA-carboxylase] ligase
LSSTVGAHVRVALEGRTVEGRAEGIDETGHLLIRTDSGTLERIVAGDVQMLRAEG